MEGQVAHLSLEQWLKLALSGSTQMAKHSTKGSLLGTNWQILCFWSLLLALVSHTYSNTSSDYEKSGYRRTAEDAYAFLIKWFQRFPHYKTREFYIAGESYGGYYIPELANVILKRNMNMDFKIPLKGIMIGNGRINKPTDRRGNIDFLWSHALISDEAYQILIGNCSDHFMSFKGFDIGNIDPLVASHHR